MQGGWGWFDQQLITVEGRVHEGFEHRCTDEPWIEGDTPALMLMGRALRGVASLKCFPAPDVACVCLKAALG